MTCIDAGPRWIFKSEFGERQNLSLHNQSRRADPATLPQCWGFGSNKRGLIGYFGIDLQR